ncbi:hypothetical protein Tco_0227514 [Tanacetum coccineum]
MLIRNKARLVAKCMSEEGVNFEESLGTFARLEQFGFSCPAAYKSFPILSRWTHAPSAWDDESQPSDVTGFTKVNDSRFEMSLMGEIEILLGLRSQSPIGTNLIITNSKDLKEVKESFNTKGTINMGLCWMSKKQNCTAMSLTEAEYVALSASCAQVMWMRTQLPDYGFQLQQKSVVCDSQSAIAIHATRTTFRTKHSHTRSFIKEQC